MSDEIQKNISRFAFRHGITLGHLNETGGRELECVLERFDAQVAEIERLRAERNALKSSAREFLTTLGAAMKTGKFHMNGSADMCHFVRQAMQKLDVLAFDREEKRPVGLERLHEEAKP
jgi:hypothetical protein